jgi:tRNA pseudouridine38-40 synthase
MRYLIQVAYEGAAYAGWQRQGGMHTVAGALEAALSKLLAHPIEVTGAGRTDRGVHATGQYAHWDTEKPLPTPFLPRLNALLPEDIRVSALFQVGDTFHARHSALSRHYRYFLGQNIPLFWRRYVYEVAQLPSLERLREAAAVWIGEKDFGAFCKGAKAYAHTTCRIYRASWSKRDYPNGAMLLVFDVEANRFLHGMVRFLVGASLRYAMGRLAYERLLSAIEMADRRWGLWEAPAQGLFLYAVQYPSEALYLLERYGPSSAEPFPAPDSSPGAESAPDSGGAPSGAASSGLRPAH